MKKFINHMQHATRATKHLDFSKYNILEKLDGSCVTLSYCFGDRLEERIRQDLKKYNMKKKILSLIEFLEMFGLDYDNDANSFHFEANQLYLIAMSKNHLVSPMLPLGKFYNYFKNKYDTFKKLIAEDEVIFMEWMDKKTKIHYAPYFKAVFFAYIKNNVWQTHHQLVEKTKELCPPIVNGNPVLRKMEEIQFGLGVTKCIPQYEGISFQSLDVGSNISNFCDTVTCCDCPLTKKMEGVVFSLNANVPVTFDDNGFLINNKLCFKHIFGRDADHHELINAYNRLPIKDIELLVTNRNMIFENKEKNKKALYNLLISLFEDANLEYDVGLQLLQNFWKVRFVKNAAAAANPLMTKEEIVSRMC